MVRKDLTSVQVPPLELALGGRTYVVPPPSARKGEVMLRSLVVGTEALMAAKKHPDDPVAAAAAAEEVWDAAPELHDAMDDGKPHALERYSLTDEVVAQMLEDGLPIADIRTASQYAQYYWVYGEKMADRLVLGIGDELDSEGGGAEVPKPSKSGPGTGSPAPRSRTARSGGTGSRQR